MRFWNGGSIVRSATTALTICVDFESVAFNILESFLYGYIIWIVLNTTV